MGALMRVEDVTDEWISAPGGTASRRDCLRPRQVADDNRNASVCILS